MKVKRRKGFSLDKAGELAMIITPWLSDVLTGKYPQLFKELSKEAWELLREKGEVFAELKNLTKENFRIDVVAQVSLVDKEFEK